MQVFVNYDISDWVEIIINCLTAVGTIAAVAVAVRANKKSNEQLVSALRIQEQSKNIDLFDRRLEMIEKISNKDEVSERTLNLLFHSDKKIMDLYSSLTKLREQRDDAEKDDAQFFEHTRESDELGGFRSEVRMEIQKYEAELSKFDCPATIEQEFKDYCDANVIVCQDPIDGSTKRLNYYEIYKRMGNINHQIDARTKELCEKMESFVNESIKPLI